MSSKKTPPAAENERQFQPPRASRKPSDVADELSAEYIKASALADMGRFNIIGAYVRKDVYGEQCAFEIQLLEGENAGATGTVTLSETPVRRKLVDVVKKYGSVGPYILKEVGTAVKGNKPWGFVDPDAPESEAVGADA